MMAPILRRFARHAWRGVVLVVGLVLIAAGLIMLVTPGPGIAAILAGLALLATEFDWAKRLLDWFRRRFAAARAEVRRRATRRSRGDTTRAGQGGDAAAEDRDASEQQLGSAVMMGSAAEDGDQGQDGAGGGDAEAEAGDGSGQGQLGGEQDHRAEGDGGERDHGQDGEAETEHGPVVAYQTMRLGRPVRQLDQQQQAGGEQRRAGVEGPGLVIEGQAVLDRQDRHGGAGQGDEPPGGAGGQQHGQRAQPGERGAGRARRGERGQRQHGGQRHRGRAQP
jgi:hypothetical protein